MPEMAALRPDERVAAVARVRREVSRACRQDAVLASGEVVLVACSGGPDSLALLDALARLAPPRHWQLQCAHVDHGLRPGGEAEADRVAAACAGRDIAFHSARVTVERRGSLQDDARRARHAALNEIADRVGAAAIATGHTADDQAETVLMRALSGATPRALAAMRPRTGRLARPLLGVWRRQIVDYCAALGLDPLMDPSNQDPRFLRSRVRHELLPALEAVFPGARRRLVALAEHQWALLAPPSASMSEPPLLLPTGCAATGSSAI